MESQRVTIGTDHDPADAMNSPAKSCTSWQSDQGSAFDADSHPSRELQQSQPTLGRGDVNAELTTIQPLPPAKDRRIESVFIVANNHDRASARLDETFCGDRHLPLRQMAQHVQPRQNQSAPLRQSFLVSPLLPLAN
jgi:hypothetical protein